MTPRDLKPLADDIECLLAAERLPLDPPDAARHRVRARVEGTLGMVAVATAAGVATHTVAATTAAASAPVITAATAASAAGTASTATPAALLSLTSVKVAVCVIGAAAAVGTGAYVGSRIPTSTAPVVVAEKVAPRPARPRVAALPASPIARTPSLPAIAPPSLPAPPPVVAPPPPSPIAVPIAVAPKVAAPSPIAAAPKRIAPAKTAPAEIEDDWSLEQQLLDRARTALARGDNRQAIRLCAEHARRFPSGNLDDMREMTWIEALVASGDRDAARTRAEEFRRNFPRSLYRVKLDAVLAL